MSDSFLHYSKVSAKPGQLQLAAEVSCDLEKVLDYFGVQYLKDVRVSEFPRVIRALEKRRSA